jgi:hypothetical protein
MVAGGVLTGVGALTGKKDLMKAGSILSLAGGIGGAIAKSAAAAGSAAGASGAGAASGAGGAAAASGTADALFGAGTQAAGPGLDFAGALAAGDAAAATGSMGSSFGAAAGDALSSAGGNVLGGGMVLGGAAPSTLQQAASGLTPTDIGGFLKKAASKAGDGLEKFAPWVKENKELVDIGSRVVSSMYGPEAEMADLQRERMDYQKGLMDRAYRNTNSPVKLYNHGRGG